MQRAQYNAGFTLVELVVAITLSAIVFSFAAIFMTTPVHMYAAQTRRAALVDSADSVLRLMARDLRRALPNSVRVTPDGKILELLLTTDAARYRDDDGATATDDLDFSGTDSQFTTVGRFKNITRNASGVFSSPTSYLTIYNAGITGADAYALTDVITPIGTTITIRSVSPNVDRVTWNRPIQFAYTSPSRRVYLVSGPVTYLCDTNTRTIRRHSGYTIKTSQPTASSDMTGGTLRTGLVATNVSGCSFTYLAGAAERAGLVTLDVTVSDHDPTDPDPTSSDRVRLLHQVHVENAP